ncbi:MAG: ribose 5-phosphate isomerase B [Bacteroidales bacterium]|nr:ribose 5-phosphate isomerase B [Bacteroidales bacterium]
MAGKEKKIVIGCDHAGYMLKEYLKEHLSDAKFNITDIGIYSEETVDYPDIAHILTKSVSVGEYDFGILICGSGNGMAMTANRYKGIRAALCWDIEIAKLARLHNNANILSLPGRFIDFQIALEMAKIFICTAFEGGRHIKRIEKIELNTHS